jgi:hypothetical protein
MSWLEAQSMGGVKRRYRMLLTKYRAYEIVDSVVLTKDEIGEYAKLLQVSPFPGIAQFIMIIVEIAKNRIKDKIDEEEKNR